MAKFQKGQSGNPKGRPKGSQNEKTKYIKDWLISLIGSNAKDISQSFRNLPMKERCKFISSILPYVLPKQTESKVNANVDFNQLSEEQIDKVIEGLVNNTNIGDDETDDTTESNSA